MALIYVLEIRIKKKRHNTFHKKWNWEEFIMSDFVNTDDEMGSELNDPPTPPTHPDDIRDPADSSLKFKSNEDYSSDEENNSDNDDKLNDDMDEIDENEQKNILEERYVISKEETSEK